MRRNMDLLRQIAFAIEAATPPIFSKELTIEGYDSAQIMYHCCLLHDSQLIVAGDCGSNAYPDALLISRLTSAGHDFLDAARDNTIWNKTKTLVANKVGSVSLDIFIQYLKSVALSALGLSGPQEQVP